MNCDANSLISSARCFSCIPKGQQLAVQIFLLCSWANTSGACQHDTVDNWALRVVANGGAAPSQTTLTALCEFMVGLDAAGLTPKMISILPIVPGDASPAVAAGDLIRATTPLIVGGGNDPWTNNGPFVPGDLTVNGLVGDGLSKYLNTGIVPSAVFPSTDEGGMTLYNMTGVNGPYGDMGCEDGAGPIRLQLIEFNNTNYFDCWDSINGRISFADPLSSGFLSGNRIAANSFDIYRATSVIPFGSGVHGNTAGGNIPINNSIFVIAFNSVGVPIAFSIRRYSFFAIHHGLTATKCEDFFDLIQALRTSLGGGFV